MPLTEYKEVITGPAERATAAGLRLDLDPALVARLLADATGGADSLPLLALTLSRLYLDYGSTGRLTLANYEAMGGMAHIVEAEIDKLLAADPDHRAQQLDTLRAAFIPWLATIDPDTDAPSRRVANWSELPPDSHDLIDAMVVRRLLVKDERGGETVVEVALESLLRQWDSLANVAARAGRGPQAGRQPGPRRRGLGTQRTQPGMADRRRAPGRRTRNWPTPRYSGTGYVTRPNFSRRRANTRTPKPTRNCGPRKRMPSRFASAPGSCGPCSPWHSS